jgi:hypothetical protein
VKIPPPPVKAASNSEKVKMLLVHCSMLIEKRGGERWMP